MSAAFYNPKKARRDARREAEALPILVCAPRDGNFRYLMEFTYPNFISILEVNADMEDATTWRQTARTICTERRDRFSDVEGICTALNERTPLTDALIDAPTDAETDAKNGEEAGA